MILDRGDQSLVKPKIIDQNRSKYAKSNRTELIRLVFLFHALKLETKPIDLFKIIYMHKHIHTYYIHIINKFSTNMIP